MEPLAEIGTLNTIAQVTITLLGFTGIVVVFGKRGITEWTPTDRLRFYALVAPSLTAFFCSFVPELVSLLGYETLTVWRISNGVLGLAHLANLAVFLLNPERAAISFGQRVNGLIGMATISAHFLAAFGLLPWQSFIFIFGLLQQTWIAVHNFLLLFAPTSKKAA